MHSDRENERAEGDLRKDRRNDKRWGVEKAGGRWEMPDGGTKTQHEWWLIAGGWMLGRRGIKQPREQNKEAIVSNETQKTFFLITFLSPHLSWTGVWPEAGSGCSGHQRHPGLDCSWWTALRGALEQSEPGVCGGWAGYLTGDPHLERYLTTRENTWKFNQFLQKTPVKELEQR